MFNCEFEVKYVRDMHSIAIRVICRYDKSNRVIR